VWPGQRTFGNWSPLPTHRTGKKPFLWKSEERGKGVDPARDVGRNRTRKRNDHGGPLKRTGRKNEKHCAAQPDVGRGNQGELHSKKRSASKLTRDRKKNEVHIEIL